MLIKICGLKYPDNIRELSVSDINIMGFIFYKGSKRYTVSTPGDIPHKIKKAGVFVNHELNDVVSTAILNKLDFIQLHGNEDVKYCSQIQQSGFKVIKVFMIDPEFDFSITKQYENVADLFLFDTKSDLYGGSGKKFNWELLKNYKANIPFLLSGGISEKDRLLIKEINHDSFCGIDLNSKFEIKAGLKDTDRINTFIKKVRKDELFQNR